MISVVAALFVLVVPVLQLKGKSWRVSAISSSSDHE